MLRQHLGRWSATAVAVACMVGAGLVPASAATNQPPAPAGNGYWLLTGNGGVYTFGTRFFGAPASDSTRCPTMPLPGRAVQPNGTCWSMAATPDGNGYWTLNSLTGAISRYGNAGNFGDPQTKFAGTSSEFLPVMRQIVSTPQGTGYWVYEVGASNTGTVDHYGNAGFYGDTTALAEQHPGGGYNGQPVAIAPTTDGLGYWEVYSDGGIFAFGDAHFAGSMAGHRLAAPIVGIAASATGNGYLLASSDGGVFAFGDARFAGSMAGLTHAPIVGITRNPSGPGYWLASNTGEIFSFGGAPFLGTLSTLGLHGHVYAIASR
jgi:hypothetical protein